MRVPGVRHFNEDRRRFGMLPGLHGLSYRALRRVIRFRVFELMIVDVSSKERRQHPDREFRFLTAEELRQFAQDPQNDLNRDMHLRLRTRGDYCFAALEHERLLNFCWYATGAIEPEHCFGSSMTVPPHMAYLFKAYTRPESRGRAINQESIRSALGQLAQRGITQVIAGVECDNWSSQRSFRHVGFRSLGTVYVAKLGARSWIRPPVEAQNLGIQFSAEIDVARCL